MAISIQKLTFSLPSTHQRLYVHAENDKNLFIYGTESDAEDETAENNDAADKAADDNDVDDRTRREP